MDIQFPSPLLSMNQLGPASQPTQASDTAFQQALDQAAGPPNKVEKAAKQFEALMIGQVLKAAHAASDGGWLGTGDDPSGGMTMELAEQQLAQALSARGGLGIAKLVTKNLDRGNPTTASSGTPNPSIQVQGSKDSNR